MVKLLRSFGLLAAMAAITACATSAPTPVMHQVSLGGADSSPGHLKAGPGERVSTGENAATGFVARNGANDTLQLLPAIAQIDHISRSGKLLHRQWSTNVKTTAGIDFLFAQAYAASGAQSNGLAYIGLSNDSLTETTASTTLSNEITGNGLARAIATYAHTAGQATATLSKTFTCATNPQAAQKAALFSAASSGTMTHVLSFTQRSLQVGDQLAITFTITLSYGEQTIPVYIGALSPTWERMVANDNSRERRIRVAA